MFVVEMQEQPPATTATATTAAWASDFVQR
jgi:hypothetical protein